ncbi:GTP-binding protein [Spirochaetota bacterium]
MSKEYSTENIRNIALIGHLGTGKSTLFDAMLCSGGQIGKIGNPDQGLTSDFDEDEKVRKISIRSALGFVEHDGVKINIIDTPGTSDFIGESRPALQVADTAIVVIDAVEGVQNGTEKAWRYISENNIPCIFYINKMDKERTSYDKVLENIKNGLKANTISLCIPQGEGDSFKGVVDLVSMNLMAPKGDNKPDSASAIPDDLKDDAELAKVSLMEKAADGDDELVDKYLEEETLSDDEIKLGLGKLVASARAYPVVCGESTKGIGAMNLMNIIKEFAPAPQIGREYTALDVDDNTKETVIKSAADGDVCAVVWKTVIDQYAGKFTFLKIISGTLLPDCEIFNVNKNEKERISKIYTMVGNKQVDVPKLNCGDIGILVKLEKASTGDTITGGKSSNILQIIKLPEPVFSYAVVPVNKPDVDKIGQYFNRISEENPTIKYAFNAETSESVLSGMGERQLNIILKTLKEKNKIDVITSEPRVAYRETVSWAGLFPRDTSPVFKKALRRQ